MIICKNLDKGLHIVSKKILMNKGLRIFAFLNEATLRFCHLLFTSGVF